MRRHLWATAVLLACGGGSTSDEGSTGSESEVTSSSTTADAGTSDSGDASSGESESSSGVGDTESGGDGDAGGDGDSSGESGTGMNCDATDVLSFDFETMQDDVLGALTGETQIQGNSLANRATNANRSVAREYLVEQLSAQGVEAQLHEYSAVGANVYAILESTTGSDEYVLFGAHFDSVNAGPGAGDNATGTVMVLAAARYAATLPCRDRNLVFALFDQEEIGLVGSHAFAAWIGQEGWNLHSAHTIDMVSWDEDGDGVMEVHSADGDLFSVYQSAAMSLGTGIELTDLPGVRSSDHTAFRQAGYDAVGLMEEWQSGDTTPHYHTPQDTYDKVDLAYLANCTRLVLQVVADMSAVE